MHPNSLKRDGSSRHKTDEFHDEEKWRAVWPNTNRVKWGVNLKEANSIDG